MRYIKGINRRQSIIFPESVDDYVDENNPVRFIDGFIDGSKFNAVNHMTSMI